MGNIGKCDFRGTSFYFDYLFGWVEVDQALQQFVTPMGFFGTCTSLEATLVSKGLKHEPGKNLRQLYTGCVALELLYVLNLEMVKCNWIQNIFVHVQAVNILGVTVIDVIELAPRWNSIIACWGFVVTTETWRL